MGLWEEFSDYLKDKGVKVKRPINFEEIGEQCIARNGYTAVVYADGNAMGKLIKEIESKDSTMPQSDLCNHGDVRSPVYPVSGSRTSAFRTGTRRFQVPSRHRSQ